VLACLVGAIMFGSLPAAEARSGLIELLADGLPSPNAALGPSIDAVLDSHQVGSSNLGLYLETLHFEGCLDVVRDDLTAGLDLLRGVHVAAVESRSIKRVWRAWERRLGELSPDAYLLVTTWLDSPETATRLFLCDDGLPSSWTLLSAPAFVIEAVTWFDIAVAEREHVIHKGIAADHDLAVMQLMELRVALMDRFDVTYPEDPLHQPARDQFEERLALMWDTLLEPWHAGFSPRGRPADPEVDSKRKQKIRFQSPTGGIMLPDPRELAVRDRVVRGWQRQRALIDRDIEANEERLQEALARLESGPGGASRDKRLREAARLQAELDHSISDLERMQARVFNLRTGRAFVDSMLDRGFRKRAVRKLGRREQRLVKQRASVQKAIAVAVAKGGADPMIRPTAPDATAQPPTDMSKPGPGNWLAGLTPAPGGHSGSRVAIERDGTIAGGSGWIERIYEGPLPTPSGTWSEDLVAAISKRHVGLDELDVRILLGLVQLAYAELPGRSAVERAVWRSLAQGDGLRIRGEETSLSELWKPGLSHAEQPAVTFILTLYF
jgi:hypothetical protein